MNFLFKIIINKQIRKSVEIDIINSWNCIDFKVGMVCMYYVGGCHKLKMKLS